MNVLLTGASSFTGHRFAKELSRDGHMVTGLFQRENAESYSGLRGRRLADFQTFAEPKFGISFGTPEFLKFVSQGSWGVYCHHGADVTDYKSEDFDAVNALRSNTLQLRNALKILSETGCLKVAVTGSVFEGGEGAGSEGLPHFSPYGLSKALTWQFFEFEAARAGLTLGKFVIPNPFGPLEEPRFVRYLMKTWFEGREAQVMTPDYVRDNIHVGLLARDYVHFLEGLPNVPGIVRRNPSGIVGEQGAFAQRVAREMRARLKWECGLELGKQTTFDEPKIRINTDPALLRHPFWNEVEAWDQLAEFYQRTLSRPEG